MRRKAVVPTVPGQEGHRTVAELVPTVTCHSATERCLDLDFDRVVEQSVETGPADHADISARFVDHLPSRASLPPDRAVVDPGTGQSCTGNRDFRR